MKTSVRAMLYTKQLYRAEVELMNAKPQLKRDKGIGELRRIAQRECPGVKVVAGRGASIKGNLYSFAQGNLIVLKRSQRCLGVLLHELAHVQGNQREYDHGPAFRRRYLRLLVKHSKGSLGI